METRVFTSCLLMFKNNILILKRSPNAEFKPNIWDSVGGHIGEYETAENCILREAKEETGLVVEIVSSGKSYEINKLNFGKKCSRTGHYCWLWR